MIAFPSGLLFEIWQSVNHSGGLVHLFGELDLPKRQTRDEALASAQTIASQLGYRVRSVGDNQIEVWGYDTDQHLLLTYEDGELLDVERLPYNLKERPLHPGHQLMTDALREALPSLYSQESKGVDALAVVKYFHPASHWTWYASEFDGQDIFFGLVIGDFIELGTFSLSELQAIGRQPGSRVLPIERDLYYQPQSLKQLRDYHRQLRGE